MTPAWSGRGAAGRLCTSPGLVPISMTMPATLSPHLTTILLLVLSNVFMTLAWYGHLKFKSRALWLVILASWSIAFFEYCLQVPANRWGHGVYNAAQLKTLQEVITLVVFVGILGVVPRRADPLEPPGRLRADRRGVVPDLRGHLACRRFTFRNRKAWAIWIFMAIWMTFLVADDLGRRSATGRRTATPWPRPPRSARSSGREASASRRGPARSAWCAWRCRDSGALDVDLAFAVPRRAAPRRGRRRPPAVIVDGNDSDGDPYFTVASSRWPTARPSICQSHDEGHRAPPRDSRRSRPASHPADPSGRTR